MGRAVALATATPAHTANEGGNIIAGAASGVKSNYPYGLRIRVLKDYLKKLPTEDHRLFVIIPRDRSYAIPVLIISPVAF